MSIKINIADNFPTIKGLQKKAMDGMGIALFTTTDWITIKVPM